MNAIVRPIRPKKKRAKPGKAIRAKWLTPHVLAKLKALVVKATKERDLLTWRRAKAVLDYLRGKTASAARSSTLDLVCGLGRIGPPATTNHVATR
jgi:hypothetical protein